MARARVPTVYTGEQVLAGPLPLNVRLGTYTNFVTLLDLCALAGPAAMRADGTPFGVPLIAPAGCDAALASIGRAFHADTALPLGATGAAQPPLAAITPRAADGEIAFAVVGAHLSGMPLNRELTASGARFLEESATAADYRLFLLPGAPAKPGLLRVDGGGAAIAVELWAMLADAFGGFVATVPPPLAIGTLTLADGRNVKGFLVEAAATAGARDISAFGAWPAVIAPPKPNPYPPT